MTEHTLLPFDLPACSRKKVTAAFDGGLISSDGGLVLLRDAERRRGLADVLAGCLRDRRAAWLVRHGLERRVCSDVFGLIPRLNFNEILRDFTRITLLEDGPGQLLPMFLPSAPSGPAPASRQRRWSFR